MTDETEITVKHKEFEVHILNQYGIDKAKMIAIQFNNLLGLLSQWCPEGREFSITRTKLEEACFFAKKAMACEPINQHPEQ